MKRVKLDKQPLTTERSRKTLWIILAAVVSASCIALALFFAFRGDGGSRDESSKNPPDRMLEEYEDIARLAEEAMLMMKELEEGKSVEDYSEYYSEIEEALLLMDELYDELDAAAQEMDETAEVIYGEYQEYEQLYEEITQYYDYLEEVCEQAIGSLEYLLSVSPALKELEQIKDLSERISRIPAAAQGSEAVRIIMERASGLDEYNQQYSSAKGTFSGFSSFLEELIDKSKETSLMLEQALSAGDIMSLKTYAAQMSTDILSLQSKLQSSITSFIDATVPQLEALTSAVSGAIP